MKQEPLHLIRLGEKAHEPSTLFRQVNEERLNENFRRLFETIEAMQAEIDDLRQE